MTEDDTPDSPDSIDLTQGEGHWARREEREEPKDLEEMTPDEVREKYPKRADEIIESLAETDGTKIAEMRAEEEEDGE